jgi:hypothetical protein
LEGRSRIVFTGGGLRKSSKLSSLMRRATAISLMLAFIAAFAMPLSSESSSASVPACCRRNGKHHCAGTAYSSSSSSSPVVAAQRQHCPLWPSALKTTPSRQFVPSASAILYAAISRHPALHVQVARCARISEIRSHQKRGPPHPILIVVA